MRIDVYSRHDAYLGTISAGQLLQAVHTDELNGEDSLTISTTFSLCEGMRLVWADRRGVAHEHVCQDPRGESAGGAPVYTDTALNSICELFGDYIDDKRPHGYGFMRALGIALEPTRWAVGTVDQPGVVSKGLTFYHTSAREAVQAVLECGGELETGIEVGDSGVSKRLISIRRHRGESGGHRRFSSGKDINGIARTEHWGAISACYGYGRGVETENGGYGRKLTFGDINGGKNYVEDDAALKVYGRPDGGGGLAHIFGKYENPECEDARQLMAETRAYLDAHKTPGVTYEADVLDLVAMGREWEGVGVGDDVQIVDSSFTPTLRCEGRVTKLVTDLLGGTQTVSLGNITETMADVWQRQQRQIGSLQRSAGNWDAASSTSPSYLEQLVSSLNERFNQQGMSYTHMSFEHGLIVSSVPLGQDMRPTKRPAAAIQLKGGGLRIASSVKPDGSFNWRTFGTGSGFTADCLTAGVLSGGSNYWNLETGDLLFRQGGIRDAKGATSWNLDTGEFVARNADISGRVTAGSGTIGGFAIGPTSISNDAMALASNGLRLERRGREIGLIGTNGLKTDDTKSGLNFDMEDSGDYMAWSAKSDPSADSYSMFLAYAKRALPVEGGGSWGADMLHIARDVDMHKYVMRNAYIDPDTGGARGGISATIDFVQVLGVNGDGTVSKWGSDARMVFKHGLLVDLKYYTR